MIVFCHLIHVNAIALCIDFMQWNAVKISGTVATTLTKLKKSLVKVLVKQDCKVLN